MNSPVSELVRDFLSRAIAFDTETELIQPGLQHPPMVCGSAAEASGADIFDVERTLWLFREILAGDSIMVGANIPFDMLVCAKELAARGIDVMPDIFAKYDRDQVHDVQTAEALFGIAHGHLGTFANGMPMKRDNGKVTKRYSLKNVVQATLGRKDAKLHDKYRLRYHELKDIPIAEWPESARVYPVDDAENTLLAAAAQWERAERTETNLHNLPDQVRAHFAMSLGAARGFRVDGEYLDRLQAECEERRAALLPRWQALGFYREDGSQDTAVLKESVARAYGASDPCPACAGVCFQCRGSGRVRGKLWKPEKPKFKKCPNCKGGRPPCETCCKTGLDIDAAPVPRTDKNDIGKGRDELNESGDDTLMDLAGWLEDKKMLETYIPWLREGVGKPRTLSPNVLVETGRTSYGLVHQMPRNGGLREAIIARPGMTLSSTDYGQLELYTHAESCLTLLGYSHLAEALNAGVEVHVKLAAMMGGISYEEGLALHEAKDKGFKALRQAAKPGNYGFPGGMGAFKLVLQQRKQGPDTGPYKGLRFCMLVRGAERCGVEKVSSWKGRDYTPACRACVEVSEEMREAWFSAFSENRDYFKLVAEVVEQRGYVVQHVSGRVRGGVRFTSAANGWFQGLAADGAKKALYRVARECWVGDGPLRGSHVIAFQHDEIIAEHPDDTASDAAKRIGEIMVETMAEYVPRVAKNLTAEPALMKRWYKGAEPVYDGENLIPWEPK